MDGTTPSTFSPMGDPAPSISSSTGGPTPSTPSHTTRSNNTYMYGVGKLAVITIGVFVFFGYNTFPKKQANEKKTGSTTKTTSFALVKKYTINE